MQIDRKLCQLSANTSLECSGPEIRFVFVRSASRPWSKTQTQTHLIPYPGDIFGRAHGRDAQVLDGVEHLLPRGVAAVGAAGVDGFGDVGQEGLEVCHSRRLGGRYADGLAKDLSKGRKERERETLR